MADTVLHVQAQAGAAAKAGKEALAGKPKPDPKAFKLQVLVVQRDSSFSCSEAGRR